MLSMRDMILLRAQSIELIGARPPNIPLGPQGIRGHLPLANAVAQLTSHRLRERDRDLELTIGYANDVALAVAVAVAVAIVRPRSAHVRANLVEWTGHAVKPPARAARTANSLRNSEPGSAVVDWKAEREADSAGEQDEKAPGTARCPNSVV
jgi:hypothetical protein